MNTGEVLIWLEKEGSLEGAKEFYPIFERVLKECLKANKEKVLIITDTGNEGRRIAPIVGAAYYFAAESMKLQVEIVMQTPKRRGEVADDNVIEALQRLEDQSIVVVAVSTRLGKLSGLGKSYRLFCESKGHRFVSSPSLGMVRTDEIYKVIDPIDINYVKLQEAGKRLKKKLDNANEVRVVTENGTDLHYYIRGKKAVSNDGDYSELGSGGNIPCGEVYVPPKGKLKTYGKVVIDGTLTTRKGSFLVKEPVVLNIEGDTVVSIEGGKEAEMLKESLEWAEEKAKFPWGVRRVGELGIGMNPNASLIGATIVDEKTVGTAHIALGSNYWFGGSVYAITHFDQVFKNPKIFIDGQELKL